MAAITSSTMAKTWRLRIIEEEMAADAAMVKLEEAEAELYRAEARLGNARKMLAYYEETCATDPGDARARLVTGRGNDGMYYASMRGPSCAVAGCGREALPECIVCWDHFDPNEELTGKLPPCCDCGFPRTTAHCTQCGFIGNEYEEEV